MLHITYCLYAYCKLKKVIAVFVCTYIWVLIVCFLKHIYNYTRKLTQQLRKSFITDEIIMDPSSTIERSIRRYGMYSTVSGWLQDTTPLHTKLQTKQHYFFQKPSKCWLPFISRKKYVLGNPNVKNCYKNLENRKVGPQRNWSRFRNQVFQNLRPTVKPIL
jgi:hypothetical protein